MSSRTPAQQAALEQLCALTEGDEDVSIGVLESVDWDVQRAAELIFDGPSNTPSAPAPPSAPRMERFEIDDSLQASAPSGGIAPRRPTRPSTWPYILTIIPNAVLTLLAFPFRILASILRLLRIPIPNFSSLRFTLFDWGSRSGARSVSPSVQIERWIRDLEEETGCASVSEFALSSSVETGGAGPSTISHRHTLATGASRTLPDFLISSYEEALRITQRDAKVLVVILVSQEHDDDMEFKRATLTDPILNCIIREHSMLVWGGDVRDREAYTAALKLQATTYPFVAFLALQPLRPTTVLASLATPSQTTTTRPTLTVLSRHSGLSQTTAATLLSHLQRTLFPRVEPFLAKVRADKRGLEHEREMRRQQDELFEAARRRDAEKLAKTRAVEQARIREAAFLLSEQEKKEEEAHRAKLNQEKRIKWSTWASRTFVKVHEPKEGVRLAFRMSNGGSRAVNRTFCRDETLTAVYAFVDSVIYSSSSPSEVAYPPEGTPADESALAVAVNDGWWGFDLYTSYPRQKIPWQAGVAISSVPALSGGGGIVVELSSSTAGSPKGKAASVEIDDKEDDGYESEE